MTYTWSPKLAADRTRRRLKALQRRVRIAAVAIARDWSDYDQYLVNLADELEPTLDEVMERISEGLTARLEEEAGSHD